MSEQEDLVFISSSLLGGIFQRAGLPHALIGGQAVNIYSKYRITDDFDFCVSPDPDAILRFESEMTAAGLQTDLRQNPDAASGPDFLKFSNQHHTLLVDLQTAKTEFQLGVIERARPSASGLAVATVEDLIVLKLLAMRSQDQRDLALLLQWNALDWAYIEHWAEAWDVTDRMKMMRQAQGDNHS